MITSADSVVVAHPLFHTGRGGSNPTSALTAKQLRFAPCSVELARLCTYKWHSRLPKTQRGPWQFAFVVSCEGVVYAVALWHNPSARTLPAHWLELRRLACSPGAPPNTCSRFLAWMCRYFAKHHSGRERAISYQDTAVHEGTIYRAAGWKIARVQRARARDRSKLRVGTSRAYRSSQNGLAADASEKVRWEKAL
jgi:hypothetical protein